MTKKTAPAFTAVSAYLTEVARIYREGGHNELAFRLPLQNMLNALTPGCSAEHEAERHNCGVPDFAVKRNGIVIGFAETKKIGANLDEIEKSDQLCRYRTALRNLILTDYLEFRHYLNGELHASATVATRQADKFPKISDGAKDLAELLKEFAASGQSGYGESPDAKRLAEIMAGKARYLRHNIQCAYDEGKAPDLADVFKSLKKVIIPDLKLPQFADIFAQTAVYGLFTARLESERRGIAPTEFKRTSAGQLLPQTTPFLRRFFNQSIGMNMDESISEAADDIAAMFATISLDKIQDEFGRGGGKKDDPFLHFYETFLQEYDPAKRTARGVFFTPRPVVDFIVRAVDDSLKSDFGIRAGLADEQKIPAGKETTHRVQILDPAAGTGAFLAHIVKLIHDRVRIKDGEGAWPEYAVKHLLPRLNGFEILMSAYAVCHMKMALAIGKGATDALAEKSNHTRVNVFLTNALEMSKRDIGDLPFHYLVEEAQAAERVKTKTPVMVVIGNPPYNVSSQNRGKWIKEKLKDYKHELNEQHSNLNDDYIKFIRCAEHFIEENGCGIVAMITNNSFLDGITHRQMRKHLLGIFDNIWILNLHGNATILERAPGGGADQNVFDIKQGVGIFIMVKTGKKKKEGNARVFHAKLQGSRNMKYEFLARESMDSVKWRKLRPVTPHYFFTPKNFSASNEYMLGIGIKELFRQNKSGSKTDRDSLFIDMDRKLLVERMQTLLGGNFDDEFAARYKVQDSTSYKILEKIRGAEADGFKSELVLPMLYRPFDERRVYYDPSLLSRPNNDTMRHMKSGENVALLTTRTIPANHNFTHAYVSRHIADIHAGGGQTYVFPLWVWEAEVGKKTIRRANFREEIAGKFAKQMGMKYSEEGKGAGVVSAAELFDYIYAVLHSPSYRRNFAEFLRVDFPRIPTADKREFRRLSKLGKELRELHLLDPSRVRVEDAGFLFSAEGNDIVESVSFSPDGKSGGKLGQVVINKTGRHFANVPRVAWDYCIGGYYPAQKWLKDRKGQPLLLDSQRHYRRILSALSRTAELVGKLDGK